MARKAMVCVSAAASAWRPSGPLRARSNEHEAFPATATEMTPWGWNATKLPIGAEKKARYQAEEEQCRTWERQLQLHRLDFWHCTVAQASQPGWPDYGVFGDNWFALVEIKARSPITGRRGKVSEAQERYKLSAEAAGVEWKTFCLPDEWDEVDEWLNGHTHRNIWGWAKKQQVAR